MTPFLHFLLLLLCSVTVHEFGHFFAALITRLRVTKIRIGSWHHLLTFRIGHTQVEWGVVPWGGYTAVHGMAPGDARIPDAGDYRTLHPAQQALVIMGGAIGNIMLAVVIHAALAVVDGLAWHQVIMAGISAPVHVVHGLVGIWADSLGIEMVGAPQLLSLDGSWRSLADTTASCNIILAVLNLLPFRNSDGSRLLRITTGKL